MIKYSEKLPLLHHRNKLGSIRTEADDSLLRNELWRSNTEPLSELLRGMSRKESSAEMLNLRASEHARPERPLRVPSPERRERRLSPLKLENSRDLLQYRKSIKYMISVFEEQSKELKSMNINCYHAPLSPAKAHLFNDLVAKEAQERRRRSKVLHLKKKLRKSLLRTEGNESPQPPAHSRRKNVTDLKKILNVNSPYCEDRPTAVPPDQKPANAILLCPHQQPARHEEPSLYSKRRLREAKVEKVERSKRTTIGGWKIDKVETTYPL